jgi:hypothetical protein
MPRSSSAQLFALDGDAPAFGLLARQYPGCVCAITLGFTRDLRASEDIAQEVSVIAWTRRHTLREPGLPEGRLRTDP